MRLLRSLTLLFFFCVDVHVKAESLPTNCWSHSFPCAVEAQSERQTLTTEGLKLTMNSNSLFQQRDVRTFELVRGRFYVETSRPVRFQTPYAKVWCEGDCRAILERETRSIQVKSLGGLWHIVRTGDETVYGLHTGAQISLSEVTADGHADMEFPQGLPWTPTVHEWSELFPGTVAEWKPLLQNFRLEWKRTIEQLSGLQAENARRSLASYAREQAETQAAIRAREREDAALRQMFREKNP